MYCLGMRTSGQLIANDRSGAELALSDVPSICSYVSDNLFLLFLLFYTNSRAVDLFECSSCGGYSPLGGRVHSRAVDLGHEDGSRAF